MYDSLIRNPDGSIDYIKIIDDKLSCINFSNNGVKQGNINNIISFFKNFLYNSDCKFVGFYKDYEVYYDEKSHLKHFVKNGKENFELLFQFNGNYAILYEGPRLGKYNGSILKEFIILGATGLITLTSFLNLVHKLEPLVNYDVNTTSYIAHNIYDSSNLDFDILDYKQAIEQIKNSNLDKKTKNYLVNEELLQDVFKYYEGTALEYTANLKFENLQIIPYDKAYELLKFTPPKNTGGCYSPLHPDKLFVASVDDSTWYYHVAAHEFIHLLQAEGLPYHYLVESSAELMAAEYYGFYPSTYSSAVENLKLLIEIVGPEPIMKMVFGGDDKCLLEIFNKHLSEEDSKVLIDALCTKVDDFTESDAEVHGEIRELLCKLYKSINNRDIKEDPNIMYEILYNKNKYTKDNDKPLDVHSYDYYYLNARKMNKSNYFHVINADLEGLTQAGYLKKENAYKCYINNITIENYYEILENGYSPDFYFYSNINDNHETLGVWNYDKQKFCVFDTPVLSYESLDNLSGKYISLEDAYEQKYINISATDIIPKEKYDVNGEWKVLSKNVYSSSNNNILDISDITDSFIIEKPGIGTIFKEQYERMTSSINTKAKTH